MAFERYTIASLLRTTEQALGDPVTGLSMLFDASDIEGYVGRPPRFQQVKSDSHIASGDLKRASVIVVGRRDAF